MKKRNILIMAIFMLLLLNILTLLYTQSQITEAENKKQLTAMATGVASLCLNRPPSDISTGTCNFTMPWGYNVSCRINSTDPENNSVIYQSYFVTPTTLFNMSITGVINYTPEESQIGNHTFKILATDMSGCDNNIYVEDFNIEIFDDNHAPYLFTIIPNQSIKKDTAYTFFLNSYFRDIDNDTLRYIVVQNNTLVSISIDNSSLTIIRGLDCGSTYFFFIATDPFGLTATSNTVKYTITNCPVNAGQTGSGGGGGGGGSGTFTNCVPEWHCNKWSSCFENGTRMLKCIDYKGCDPDDYIKYLYENCTYIPEEYVCEEKWECFEWSTCINQTHTRKCIDKNSCGTNNTKPLESEGCVPIASCFNGIKDGDETGVDCGGVCGACKIVEQPTQVSGIDSRIIIAGIIILATLALVVVALRKQIEKAIQNLVNYRKKKKQPYYLNEIQKQKLLNIAFNIQDGLIKNEPVHNSIKQFIQLYFIELLSIQLVNKESINKNISKIKNKQLEIILLAFYNKMNELKKMTKEQMQETIDEIFNNIYLVSEFHEKDALVLPKEREIDSKNELIIVYQKLSNLHILLEFKEMIEAKKLYKEIIEDYEKLNKENKIIIYNDVMIGYSIIMYLERFY